MKTTDLIPLILLELNDGDKYGFELTKSIETKSNGKIIIKQPTLYTVLKKLEKSKFISSYWQDSDIGGKRHYYKITDNGRLQVSTLPSFDILLNSIDIDEDGTTSSEDIAISTQDNVVKSNNLEENKNLEAEDFVPEQEFTYASNLEQDSISTQENANDIDLQQENIIEPENVSSEQETVNTFTAAEPEKENDVAASPAQADLKQNYENISQNEEEASHKDEQLKSIFDLLPVEDDGVVDIAQPSENQVKIEDKQPITTPTETILPTENVFEEENLDNSTELEINLANATILKDEQSKKDEHFASNAEVAKFTQKTAEMSDEYKQKILEHSPSYTSLDENLQIANTADEIKSVNYVNFTIDPNYIYSKKIAKNLFWRSICDSCYLLIALLICAFVGAKSNAYYYILAALAVVGIILPPVLISLNYNKLRVKYKTKTYTPNLKMHLIIIISVLVVVLAMSIIVSAVFVKTSIDKMFNISNFYNLYAPLILCLVVFIDLIADFVIFKNIKRESK